MSSDLQKALLPADPPSLTQKTQTSTKNLIKLEELLENELKKLSDPDFSPSSLLLECSLKGPTHNNMRLEYIPKSNILISSGETELKFWDLGSKKEIWSTIFCYEIKSLLYVAEKRILLLGADDKSIRAINIETKEEMHCLTEHDGEVSCLCYDADEDIFVSGSGDSNIKIWNINTMKAEATLSGHTGDILALALNSVGTHLLSSSMDYSIRYWNIEKKSGVWVISKLDSMVNTVAFCKKTDYFLTDFSTKNIKLWNIKDQTEVHVFQGHDKGINKIIVDEDAENFFSFSNDNTVKVWNLPERRCECTLVGHKNSIEAGLLVPNEEFLISAGEDLTINIWRLRKNLKIAFFGTKDNTIKSIKFAPNKKFVAASSENGELIILEAPTWKETRKKLFKYGLNYIDISSDSTMIAASSEYSQIKILSVEDLNVLFTIPKSLDYAESVCFTRDGKFLIVGGCDIKINVWDLETKTKKFVLGPVEWINFIAFSDLHQLLFSIENESCVVCWDFASQQKKCALEGHTAVVLYIKISPDEKYLASGSKDMTIKLWNLFDLSEEFTFTGYSSGINALDFSEDSNYLATSCGKDIKVWDLINKRVSFNIPTLNSSVEKLVISITYNVIISGHDEGVQIWQIPKNNSFLSKTETQPIQFLSNSAYSPDKSWVLSYEPGKCKVWENGNQEKSLFLEGNFSSLEHFYTSDGEFLIIQTINQCQAIINLLTFQIVYDKNTFSPSSLYDSHTCFLPTHCNLLSCIKKPASSCFFPSLSQVLISEYFFTLAHVLCYQGNHGLLSSILGANFTLSADIFGRSPFYYCIKKQSQKCTDFLLNYLIEKCENINSLTIIEQSDIKNSLFAIKDDFPLIIANSSQSLPGFLKALIIDSEVIFSYISTELPAMRIGSKMLSNINDFNDFVSENEQPVVLQSFYFPFISEIGSITNLNLLQAICKCTNSQIYKTKLIQYYIQNQWDSLKTPIWLYSSLFFLNLAFFLVLIFYKEYFWYFVWPFLLVNVLLLMWEILEVFVNGAVYFYEAWNYADIVRIIFTVLWLVFAFIGENIRWVEWLLALFLCLRGISAFRVIDGTRYYVVLIARALNDIKYFLVMFIYSTIVFGVLFMVERGKEIDVLKIWSVPFDINFGTYDKSDGESGIDYYIYVAASIFNVVMMLNLLVSILGDSYDQFQIEKSIIDFSDKAAFTLEIQKMMFWRQNFSNKYYLHICSGPSDQEELADWEGKVLFLERKLEKSTSEITKQFTLSQTLLQKQLSEKINLLDKEVKQIRTDFTSKFQTLDASLKKQLSSIDEKLEKLLPNQDDPLVKT